MHFHNHQNYILRSVLNFEFLLICLIDVKTWTENRICFKHILLFFLVCVSMVAGGDEILLYGTGLDLDSISYIPAEIVETTFLFPKFQVFAGHFNFFHFFIIVV